MNVTGKGLQEIYNAGEKRLEELEVAQKQQLGDTTDTHLEEREKVHPEAIKHLEKRCGELETEIQGYLEHGLERVQTLVQHETQYNQKCVERLVDGLGILARRFTESIGQLREAAERQLNDQANDTEQLYKNAGQATGSQINNHANTAIDACRTEGSRSNSELLTTIDASWNTILETEDEVVADVLGGYDASAGQINDKSLDGRTAVETLLSDKLSKLELRSMQATESIRSAVDRLLETADRHAFDCDVKLKEHFSSLLYESTTAFDDASQRAVSDVGGLHESSMADLGMKSQELSREMDSLAANIVGGAESQYAQLEGHGNGLLGKYTDELSLRSQNSEVFHKELEQERLQMVSEIWRELSDVRSKFEERLSNLAQSTLSKMRNICDEAETAIIGAQQNCVDESRRHAGDKQDSIETAAREFLKRVENTRDSALDAIAKAAGAGADDEAPKAASDPDGSAESQDTDESNADAPSANESRRRRKSGKNNDKRGEGKK